MFSIAFTLISIATITNPQRFISLSFYRQMMTSSSTPHALRYYQHGTPLDVIKYERDEPIHITGSKVHVRMLAAAINPF